MSIKIIILNPEPYRNIPIINYEILYNKCKLIIKYDCSHIMFDIPTMVYLIDSNSNDVLCFRCYTLQSIGNTPYDHQTRKVEMRFSEFYTIEIGEFNLLLI